MSTLEQIREQNFKTLAKVSQVAKLIAEISAETGVSIEDLLDEYGMIKSLAVKELA